MSRWLTIPTTFTLSMIGTRRRCLFEKDWTKSANSVFGLKDTISVTITSSAIVSAAFPSNVRFTRSISLTIPTIFSSSSTIDRALICQRRRRAIMSVKTIFFFAVMTFVVIMSAAFVVFIFLFSLYMNNHIDQLGMIMPQLDQNCKLFLTDF